MKRVIVFVVSALLLIGLAACQAAQATATASANPVVNTTPMPGGGNEQGFELSASMKLAVGTLKLADTDQAVTAEQAQALLPLWKAVKSLSSSETITQAEIDALYQQIEESMTAEQMQAIDAMQVNQEDISALMEDLGVQAGPGVQGTPDASGENTTQRFQPGGDFTGGPGGGGGGGAPPSGGGGGGGGEGMPGGGDFGGGMGGEGGFPQGTMTSEQGTAIANRAGRMNQYNPFTDAVIELLEGLIAA